MLRSNPHQIPLTAPVQQLTSNGWRGKLEQTAFKCRTANLPISITFATMNSTKASWRTPYAAAHGRWQLGNYRWQSHPLEGHSRKNSIVWSWSHHHSRGKRQRQKDPANVHIISTSSLTSSVPFVAQPAECISIYSATSAYTADNLNLGGSSHRELR